MADNSLQGGTDSIRDIDRSGGGTGPKTQVFQLDHGGAGAVAESLTSTTNPLPSYRPDLVASGTLAALNATIVMVLNGIGGMRVQITGTWVGTIQFEGTVDGTTWVAVNAVQAGSTTIPQNTTVNGLFSPTPAGFASFRVNMTAFTSGTATVTMRGSNGTGGIYHNQYLPAFSVIPAFKIDQTTPGTTNLVAISGTVPVSGTFFQGTQPVSIATMPSTPVTGTFWQATQPVSGTVTINAIPTGANTIGNVGLVAGAAAIGTVAINAALPTGTNVIGALTANQSVNNAQIGGVAPLMGNGVTGTGSQRVTIASDNTAFSVNAVQSGAWNITNVSGTVSLPTGASTETTLAAVSGKLPATLGAKASSASLAVVQATDAYALQPASSTSYLASSAATNNLTQIKATAGAIKTIHGYNARTSAVRIKLFGLPSASVTAGTTAAAKSIYLPASTAFVFDFPAGYAPSGGTGLSYMLTTLGGLTDNTAVAAGDILDFNVDYL